MSDEQPDAKRLADSFGAVAQSYDRGRPAYPAEAAAWLLAGEARIVLELGAGTGKLTRELVDQGHAVFATDKDPAMLEVLKQRVPEVSAKVAAAEEIPANDRSVDVVVAAQSFHWFDRDRALPEIARVLRPGGHVALVWNLFDQRIPWVRKLVQAMGEDNVTTSSHEALADSDLFGEVESKTFAFWQDITRDTLVDIAASHSHVAALPEDEREARLDAVRALYDDYGRGHDGMQLPYVVECFRAQVVDQRDTGVEVASETTTEEGSGASQERPIISDGTDTDMLLIDFR
ncbi:class I SAM-dependent methyltransferase [Nocardioides piscis]|uniref:Class I SAM-dependent methyltransferase n=1 Tax=Nocardioides piscis TaxID=2714938 RepID=A0A6G7YD82_9ACTN|nr:class I SAM-dependent methyltransferase [Nocardioides piscis]QIK74636.1 class I SAM-dependent methyltransferase [Nocardioides piscis]